MSVRISNGAEFFLQIAGKPKRHLKFPEKMIGPFQEKNPAIHPTAFIHSSAEIYGEVTIGEKSAVFQFCVMRGDINFIQVGNCTNIQELSVLHVSDGHPCILGNWITVGHNATIHGATIENGAMLGIGSVILDGAIIGEEAWVAAGCLVPSNMKVPPHTLAAGIPAKIIRELTPDEIKETNRKAQRYIENLAPWYKAWQEKNRQ